MNTSLKVGGPLFLLGLLISAFLIVQRSEEPSPEPKQEAKREPQEALLVKLAAECRALKLEPSSRESCPPWRFHQSRLRRGKNSFAPKNSEAQARLKAAEQLLGDQDPWVRSLARGFFKFALPRLSAQSKNLNALLGQLEGSSPEEVADLLNILGAHGGKELLQPLKRLSQNETPEIRALAWQSLSLCIPRGCRLGSEELRGIWSKEKVRQAKAGMILYAGRLGIDDLFLWCADLKAGPELGACRTVLKERGGQQAFDLLLGWARSLADGQDSKALAQALSDLGQFSQLKERKGYFELLDRLLGERTRGLKFRLRLSSLLLFGKEDPQALQIALKHYKSTEGQAEEEQLRATLSKLIYQLGGGEEIGYTRKPHQGHSEHKEEGHKGHKH